MHSLPTALPIVQVRFPLAGGFRGGQLETEKHQGFGNQLGCRAACLTRKVVAKATTCVHTDEMEGFSVDFHQLRSKISRKSISHRG